MDVDYPQMSREQLLAELQRLQAHLREQLELQATLRHSEEHQAEIRLQNEQLLAAKAALEASRNCFHDMFEFAPIAYVMLDAAGKIKTLNAAAVTLLGQDRKAAIGKPLREWVHPHDRQHLPNLQVPHDQGHNLVTAEMRLLTPDGREIPVQLHCRHLHQEGEDHSFRVAIIDQTLNKRGEELLRRAHDELEHRVQQRTQELEQANSTLRTEIAQRQRAQEQLQLLYEIAGSHAAKLDAVIESIPDAVFFGSAQRMTRCNSAALRFANVTSLRELNRRLRRGKLEYTLRRPLHTTPLPRQEEPFSRALRGEIVFEELLLRRNAREEELLVRTVAAPIYPEHPSLGVVAIVSDLTERKHVEDALRTSEERFRLMAATIPNIIFTTRADLTTEYVNERFTQYTGLPQHAAYDWGWCQIVHPDDLQRSIDRTRHCEQTGIPYEVEHRLRNRVGNYRWFVSRAIPIRNAQGETIQWFGCSTDIDDLKRAEEELQQLNETLERRVEQRTALADQRSAQLQAMALALTQAEQRERRRLAQILHDHLQQLLVGAKLQVTMLRDSAQDLPIAERMQIISEAIAEAIETSRSLAVELSPPLLYELGLPHTIHWLARKVREQHGLQVDVTVEGEPDPDTDEIKTLLFNAVRELLLNVLKHAHTNRARVVMTTTSADRVQIVVEDDGQGFDPAARFEEGAGTGYGLFGIEERLQLLGGSVHIESAPQQGTRITLAAPRHVSSLPSHSLALSSQAPLNSGTQQPPLESRDSASPGKQLRVLLVDDHALVRETLANLLQLQPQLQLVGEAAHEEMALQLARQVHPDLVVMNVSMLGIDGTEATRKLKAEMPDLRVVGLAMHHSEQIVQAMYEAGASACITKDAPANELLAAIFNVGHSR